MGLGQLKIAVALFAVAVMAASVLGGVWFWENVSKPERALLGELEGIRSEKVDLPDPGADFFDEAVEMIQEGKMPEGVNGMQVQGSKESFFSSSQEDNQ